MGKKLKAKIRKLLTELSYLDNWMIADVEHFHKIVSLLEEKIPECKCREKRITALQSSMEEIWENNPKKFRNLSKKDFFELFIKEDKKIRKKKEK